MGEREGMRGFNSGLSGIGMIDHTALLLTVAAIRQRVRELPPKPPDLNEIATVEAKKWEQDTRQQRRARERREKSAKEYNRQ